MEISDSLKGPRDFFQWWLEQEGFGLRCERVTGITEAALMAWEARQEEIDMLKSRIKVLEEECHWLNSVGPDSKSISKE